MSDQGFYLQCPNNVSMEVFVEIMESRITKRRGNEIARHACADSKNVGMIERRTVVQPVDADRV